MYRCSSTVPTPKQNAHETFSSRVTTVAPPTVVVFHIRQILQGSFPRNARTACFSCMRVQAQNLLICSRLLCWSSKLLLTRWIGVYSGSRRRVNTLFSCQPSSIGRFLRYKYVTLVIGRTSVSLRNVLMLLLDY